MSDKVSDQFVILAAKNGGSFLIEFDQARGRDRLIILENGERVSVLDIGSAGIIEIRPIVEAAPQGDTQTFKLPAPKP